jgi:surface antigen
MKRIATLIFALSLMSGATAMAMERPPGRGQQGQHGPPPGAQQGQSPGERWSRGQRLPDQYRQDQYAVSDWRQRNLSPPPRGYRWMCYQGRNCYLVANNTGVVRERRLPDERETYWRQRYSRTYSYNDDIYYRECRDRSDPAGILIGGIIGGLLGRAVDDRGAGATVAGVIIGAAVGAAVTRDLDCDDRSYAYRTYHDALNRGSPGSYQWRNPQNNHRGDFRVRSYYFDQSGFQCANYSQTVYLDRQRQANGRACRQPDGAWVFLD